MEDDNISHGDKSPCELIDEEERKNNPAAETQDQLEKEIQKEKDRKEKEIKKRNPTPPLPDNRTPDERERDQLRTRIDLITYQHRLANLDEHLEQELKRSRMRMESDLEDLEFQKKKRKITHESEIVQAKLDLKTKRDKWRKWVDREPDYLLNPVRAIPGTHPVQTELVISDRTIHLTGVISYETSEYITDRIHYYNNQNDTYPIFLLIDYSPGGSVMSGYRILKAIESSPAPVYVVVKSYAASMAAMITSLAPYSFVYPNAIILHHQIWSKGSGNLKQQKEQLEDLNQWWIRLAGPFANKLNISLDQLIDKMYHHNSDGDWRVFGDQAVELGWAQQVVHRIRKTGAIKCPDDNLNSWLKLFNKKEVDPSSQILPKLRPMDYYWLYNPSGYYQNDTS